MKREHKIYIPEWSKKCKLNTTLITFVFEVVNPNICRFQSLDNIFLRITFAVQYFYQKILKDTRNHLFPGKIQGKANTFDGSYLIFL